MYNQEVETTCVQSDSHTTCVHAVLEVEHYIIVNAWQAPGVLTHDFLV